MSVATLENQATTPENQDYFFRMSFSVMDKLLAANLSAAEMKLYLYLCKLEALGNRYVELPNQSEIALELGISRKTVNRAQARLQELDLFDFKISKWECRNLMGAYSEEYKTRNKNVPGCNKNVPARVENVPPVDEKVTQADKNVSPQAPEALPQKCFSVSKDFKDLKDFKKKKARPVEKQISSRKTSADQFTEWFNLAYAAGIVVTFQGSQVLIRNGLYGGCYRDWKEVAEQYPTATLRNPDIDVEQTML